MDAYAISLFLTVLENMNVITYLLYHELLLIVNCAEKKFLTIASNCAFKTCQFLVHICTLTLFHNQ